MTIGQRIAQKRKELGLSQEALGDRLGVSRQSIYKWESDTALPEIDKLIALSRLFGVSVGWLLGVEEPPRDGEAAETPAPEPGELTEQQLKMVEEIVRRYSGARGLSPRRRRVLKLALAAGAVCLAGVLYSLFSQLGRLDQQYTDLQSSIRRVESGVDGQIGSISNRVEEILKAQNSLLADYGAEVAAVDPAANTVTFSVHAVPKTYVEGMSVEFLAENGETASDRLTRAGEEGSNQRFSATLSVPLTDSITLSALLVLPDGTRSTQLLDQFDGLYSGSLPAARVGEYSPGDLLGLEPDGDGPADLPGGGRLTLPEMWVTVSVSDPRDGGDGQLPCSAAETVRAGLFRNQVLVTWLEPCEQPPHFQGDLDGQQFFYLPEGVQVYLSGPADQLVFAALVTDEYSREVISSSIPYALENGALTWVSGSMVGSVSPEGWDLGG